MLRTQNLVSLMLRTFVHILFKTLLHVDVLILSVKDLSFSFLQGFQRIQAFQTSTLFSSTKRDTDVKCIG